MWTLRSNSRRWETLKSKGPTYALGKFTNHFWGPKIDLSGLYQDLSGVEKHSGMFSGHSGFMFNQLYILLKEER